MSLISSGVRFSPKMSGRLKCVLVDVSGTLHVDDKPIPGALQALKRLCSRPDLRVLLVTNTTKESARVLHERLLRAGFSHVSPDLLFTSLLSARHLVEQKALRPLLLLEEEAMEDFRGIETQNPNAVVLGLAPSKFNYKHMNDAFRLLLGNPDAPLIGIHKGRYYKGSDGLRLGPGPFVAALEYACDRSALLVGKPEVEFFHSALRKCASSLPDSLQEVTPNEAVMIGDDYRDDVLGALKAGMNAILVRTGKYRPSDDGHLPSDSSCDVTDDFASAVELVFRWNDSQSQESQ